MYFCRMNSTVLKCVSLLAMCILFSGCSEYQKLLRSDDTAAKYTMADSLYKAKKYKKALPLMEQIVPIYRGKPQAEPLMYRYANTFYNLEDYYLAGYQFERFVVSYPQSDSLEMAAYKSARSYYELSPRYSLDQKDTYVALEKLQAFVDTYNDSEYRMECNEMVQELKVKLELKDIETAKQYRRISDYKAAIKAFDNFIQDHPGSIYREDAYFGRLEAAFVLAQNSVSYLVQERLESAKKYFDSFMKYYSSGTKRGAAEEILLQINTQLQEQTLSTN